MSVNQISCPNRENAVKVCSEYLGKTWLLFDPEMKARVDAQKNDWKTFFQQVHERSWGQRKPAGEYGKIFAQESMTVRRYYPTGDNRHPAIWKVTIGPDAFFVKQTSQYGISTNIGMDHAAPIQYLSLVALSFVHTPPVRAAKPCFAFLGERSSFLVTEFVEGRNMANRMDANDKEKLAAFKKERVRMYGYRFKDIRDANLLKTNDGELVLADPLDMKYCLMEKGDQWKFDSQKTARAIEERGGWLDASFFR